MRRSFSVTSRPGGAGTEVPSASPSIGSARDVRLESSFAIRGMRELGSPAHCQMGRLSGLTKRTARLGFRHGHVCGRAIQEYALIAGAKTARLAFRSIQKPLSAPPSSPSSPSPPSVCAAPSSALPSAPASTSPSVTPVAPQLTVEGSRGRDAEGPVALEGRGDHLDGVRVVEENPELARVGGRCCREVHRSDERMSPVGDHHLRVLVRLRGGRGRRHRAGNHAALFELQ